MMNPRLSGPITTVGNGSSIIHPDRLAVLPSLHTQSHHMSDKYRQVKTMDVINLFSMQGWFPVLAQEQRVNKLERKGFQKHMIRFRQKVSQEQIERKVGELYAEIVMINSHDGTTAYVLYGGIWRLACLNGLVVAESVLETIRIKHIGFEPREIGEASESFSQSIPRVIKDVTRYKQISLTGEEKAVFAESALLLKYRPDEEIETKRVAPDRYKIGERIFDTNRLLAPVREQDRGNDLWRTFNVVQEKFTKGNNFESNPKISWRTKKVRGIKGIDESVRVNRALWHLTEEMSKLKSK